jgi:hypothetical protein
MDHRLKKRIVVVSIFVASVILLYFLIHYFLTPRATCGDGILNQNEEEMDCGGVCSPCKKVDIAPLNVEKVSLVPSGKASSYDVAAVVNNPNQIFGSKSINYIIRLKGQDGEVLSERKGNGFILPGEKKYIIENNVESQADPVSVEFSILNSDWVEFNDYYQRPDLSIVNKNYKEISSGVDFSEAKGLLKNESSFDFDLIRLKIVLLDAGGEIIAVNSTEMRTVKSGEERDFRAMWPTRFPGAVQDMKVQADVNIFKSDTFLKRFYKDEKFQEYSSN